MSRKIFALLILMGAVGALVGAYLYFFVYYTSTLTFQANIEEYKVSLFSVATAQKREEICSTSECSILKVSPFEYNITLSAAGYEPLNFAESIPARTSVTQVVEFQKKAVLEASNSGVQEQETPRQKIERLREESRYVERIDIGEGKRVVFLEQNDILEVSLLGPAGAQKITTFPNLGNLELRAESITGSKDVYLQQGDQKYIYSKQNRKLYSLDFGLDILYIKTTDDSEKYHILTEKGSFYYDVSDNVSDFQYIFHDFIKDEDTYIGIVLAEEFQKKINYNLTVSGDLIVLYNMQDKSRRVLLAPSFRPKKIFKRGEDVVVTSNEREYILENYK